jgi:ribulose-bisphosphate carboxylase large chain
MKDFIVTIDLSGERFRVVYRLQGSEAEARAKAEDICVEQTIEFPAELVKGGDIRDHILGRIESFQAVEPGAWEAVISFAIEITGYELTQLLNVVFGNTSLKPGIRVERLELPESLLRHFKGPRFGIPGLRVLLGVAERPLFCTALKPMGLSSRDLAQFAYQFALGGVDLVKDDHGLADQPFAPFKERVQRCAEAVRRANRETGKTCLYAPNLSAPVEQIMEKAVFAKAYGAGALMLAPGLVGPDTLKMLGDNDVIAMPIICHPALLGTFTAHPHHGISHYVIYGQIPRLAGADATIFPNYGGRFSFTREECRQVVEGAAAPMGRLTPIFTAPGGGMSRERIPEMIQTYGRDVIFLIGGALHQMGPDLIANCRRYMETVTQSLS